jgi:hypothetical protein
MFNSFSFSPIPDSKDKRYLFAIQASGIKKGGSSILLASPIDRYMYFGNLFVNGERQEGDLAFRILYAQPRGVLIQKSFKRIALQKPGIFSYSATYYILAISYIMVLAGFFYSLSKVGGAQDKKSPGR